MYLRSNTLTRLSLRHVGFLDLGLNRTSTNSAFSLSSAFLSRSIEIGDLRYPKDPIWNDSSILLMPIVYSMVSGLSRVG